MKIASGEFAGIPIFTPKDGGVRPTLSRTRQAVFNMLRPVISGAACVDIFCGTGAFGFEALSNGAASVVFIDRGNRELILRNAQKLKLEKSRYEIMTCDFERGLLKLSKAGFKAGIVFADPPYNSGFVTKLLKNTSLSDILDEKAVFVLEAHRKEAVEAAPAVAGWTVCREKEYGDSRIYMLNKGGPYG